MAGLGEALAQAGGREATPEHASRLRALVLAELERGARELTKRRSGYGDPVVVGFADVGPPTEVVAVVPVPAGVRVDPGAAGDRAWLLAAAVVDALTDAAFSLGERLAPRVRAGDLDGWLVLSMGDQAGGDAELGTLAFSEAAERVDRLRAEGHELPGHVLRGRFGELRPPVGAAHPLCVAELVARLGARPAEAESATEVEDRVLELLGTEARIIRPHDDPDPARRVARRILQRLAGMGKWGGYHTEFAHLARGFAGHERALADAVGEALLAAGLLAEKPSTGQRHVFLNPRRAGEIHRFIERGEAPASLRLP